MVKKAKTISSATADENVNVSQQAAAVTDEVNASLLTDENSAGAVGESVSTAIHNPESESNGMSEGSSDPAAPAPAGAIEGDTNTPQSASGAAAGEATAELVKPLTGSDPIEAIVAETDTPTFVSTSPEAEAAASGTNSEPSQGAAEDDGSMAGAVHALVIEAGAESVEQLLYFADLGRRLSAIAVSLIVDPSEWLDAVAPARPFTLRGVTESIATFARQDDAVDEAPKVTAQAIRVKSTRDGFRRAGLVHSKAGQTYEPGALTEEQIKLLDGDPAITVEYI